MQKWFASLLGKLKRFLEFKLASENERNFIKTNRCVMAAIAESKKKQQEECSHIAGGNPASNCPDYFGRTSIVWHTLNTGEEVGICLNCSREFRNTNSDFAKWRAKLSFSRPSSAIGFAGWKDGKIQLIMSPDDGKTEVCLDETVPVKVTFSDPNDYDEKWGW